ncbi:hypothetical protein Patl1_07035 [Pistacia atlantica]|uniref:Uncharacterized protein n=1 Tax=Pistacia atlantica TaxID=434234 RepID=A0ACC1AGW1_9ROSI|nr:hypothetical protein Patl1_07035 [Pistacia atlantica]
MNTQRNVSVEPLGDDDARNLFGNIVGNLTDKCDISVEIIEKCAGLPLAITTIASALKGESDYVWRDVLRQLKSSNPRCVLEMNNTLYSTIELSYALLNSEEAKSLLLLCALSDVGNNNETVKMHDITHVVVASIATEKRMFNIQDANGFKEVLVKGMYKDYIAICLHHRDIDGLPERSMAGNISQIQEIELTNCKELKEIIGQESANHVDDNERNCKVEFKQLHSLVLECLPQFISFGLKVVLPRLENLKLSSINSKNIWVDQPQPIPSYIECLKSLTMEECNGLQFMFSSSMVKSLVQLQKLVICICKSMEAVIFDSEGEDKIIDLSFPKLFYLKLAGLPQLTRFGSGNSIEFLTLNELHIEGCSNLKIFFRNSFGVNRQRKESDEVAFPSLEKMILLDLDSLQLIWHNQLHKDSFSKLKEVDSKLMWVGGNCCQGGSRWDP